MSDNETWDYIAAAAEVYASRADGADDPYYEGICYLLGREASEAAIEFARLRKEGVPVDHARMSVHLATGFGAAMTTAHGILDVSYEEWRTSAAAQQALPSAGR